MINVDITRVTDHPDGTCTIEFETDEKTLILLAKIGMQSLIEVAAGKALNEYDGGDNCEADLAGNDDGISRCQSEKNNEHEEGSSG